MRDCSLRFEEEDGETVAMLLTITGDEKRLPRKTE